jgi:hypothetical protein
MEEVDEETVGIIIELPVSMNYRLVWITGWYGITG